MKPTIGRIVIFNVPEGLKSKVNFADQLPAIIVRVWSANVVNLKVITDGPEDLWITSVIEGSNENNWGWPVIEQ